jgi:hypothetical protein
LKGVVFPTASKCPITSAWSASTNRSRPAGAFGRAHRDVAEPLDARAAGVAVPRREPTAALSRPAAPAAAGPRTSARSAAPRARGRSAASRWRSSSRSIGGRPMRRRFRSALGRSQQHSEHRHGSPARRRAGARGPEPDEAPPAPRLCPAAGGATLGASGVVRARSSTACSWLGIREPPPAERGLRCVHLLCSLPASSR